MSHSHWFRICHAPRVCSTCIYTFEYVPFISLYSHIRIHISVFTFLYSHFCIHISVCTFLYSHLCIHISVFTLSLYSHLCIHIYHVKGLRSYELHFAYVEHGVDQEALVKLRCCAECASKLNYRFRREEAQAKREKKRERKLERKRKRRRMEKREKKRRKEREERQTLQSHRDARYFFSPTHPFLPYVAPHFSHISHFNLVFWQ